MSTSRHFMLAVLLGLVVLLLGGALLVWPNYRETSSVRAEILTLTQKVNGMSFQTEAVEALADHLEELRGYTDQDLKAIPEMPDVAGLMRELSLPVDGQTVRDQTFTAGNATDVVPGEPFPELAMPLTVEMEANFDAVFALMRSTEVMDRLVRIGTVRIASEDDSRRPLNGTNAEAGGPLLSASIGLEAIYEPPAAPKEDGT